MVLNKKLTIELCSDVNYEGMVVDLGYNNHPLAIISNENGMVEIELLPIDFPIKLPLSALFAALEKCNDVILNERNGSS